MNFDTICIVGGGSAGWMTASTLIKAYPNKRITLVESPAVGTIGVGESTTQFIRRWLKFLELKDEEWMPSCDATYKYSVRFENFNEGKPFHYPFGEPELNIPIHDWFVYRQLVGEDAIGFDYTFWQYMDAVENGKYLPKEYTNVYSGFHFNAVKFAEWLRDNYAVPRGVEHIRGHITEVKQSENGFVESLQLDTGVTIQSDLFFDCTGFKSLLLTETLQVPFETFGDKLLNTHAYAVQVPYQDKKKELKPYTNCTALSSGWVWTVPVWSRIGTGYNYSEKFISHEDALTEFKQFLGDRLPEDATIRNIQFRTGISQRVWDKNVVAIGLSGGFIEPLESNGLLSVHEWLMQFVEICQRPVITTFDMDCYNYKCISFFKTFSDFVALHYALTTRCDTPYWKYITNEYHFKGDSPLFPSIHDARTTNNLNIINWENQGANLCIMAGHNYNPSFHTKIGDQFNWDLLKDRVEEIHNNRKRTTETLQDIYDYYSGGLYAN